MGGWASHILHLSKGQVVRASPISEVEEYSRLCSEGSPTPLYSLVRGWIYSEYDCAEGAKPWRAMCSCSGPRRLPPDCQRLRAAGPLAAGRESGGQTGLPPSFEPPPISSPARSLLLARISPTRP